MKNIEKLINECIKMEQSVVNDVFKVDVFKCKKELEDYKQDQALQLQQTGVMRSNCIDESPEPRVNINKFDENDYYDGKFLK